MEKRKSSEGDSSTTSPDVEAFIELVDREGYRRQLLVEWNNRNSGRQLANHAIVSQFKFEIEDFKIPDENGPRDHVEYSVGGNEDGLTDIREERTTRGTKRVRELTLLPVAKEKMHKKRASREVKFDLNKTDESFDVTN